jgi:hypothetical protein
MPEALAALNVRSAQLRSGLGVTRVAGGNLAVELGPQGVLRCVADFVAKLGCEVGQR